MKVAVLNQKGDKVKDLDYPKSFEVTVSDAAVTQYVNYLRAALRDPVANSKDRSEVSGGGRKPWKQKGTGRARHGSTRSPLWVGGGVTFGPSNSQNFKLRINKSLKRSVIISTLNKLFQDKKAIIIDDLNMSEPKTKNAIEILENIKADGKISLVFNADETNLEKSFRNIAGINLSMPGKLNIITLMSSDSLVLSETSLNQIVKIYSNK